MDYQARAMIVAELPNLFDQYSQHENRVTNALLQVLASSPNVLRSFLLEFVGLRIGGSRDKVVISAQKQPQGVGDGQGADPAAGERDSIPDGWIVCEEGDWAVAIESKVEPHTLRPEQLRGHLRAIAGYGTRFLLILTPDEHPPEGLQGVPPGLAAVQWVPWRDIHTWVSRTASATAGNGAGRYLLRSLKGFLEMDERLSGFQGFEFPEGFSTRRAKTLLKVLMQTIRPDVLEMYPALTGGRPGITLDRPMVWDCFGVEPQFTADLHLTFSIREDETVIGLPVPNAAGQRWRRIRAILGDPALSVQLKRVLAQLRRRVPELWVRLDQRHFIGMRKIVPDALLEFRVDTAPFARPAHGVRPFPIWFATAREALLHRGGANLQFMVRAVFMHAQVPAVKSPRFAHTALQTLRHFQPLYDLLRASEAPHAGKRRCR